VSKKESVEVSDNRKQTVGDKGNPGNKKGSDEKSDDRKLKEGDKRKPGKKIDSDEEESDSSVEKEKNKGGDKGKPGKIIDSDEESDSSVEIEKLKGGDKVKPGNKIESDPVSDYVKYKGSDRGKPVIKIDPDARQDILETIRLNGIALMSTNNGAWKPINYTIGKSFFIITLVKKKKGKSVFNLALKKFGPVPSLENGAIILTYNPNKSKGEDLIKIKFFGKELNGGKNKL